VFIAVETIWLNGIRINKEGRKEQSWHTHLATVIRAALETITKYIYVRMVSASTFLLLPLSVSSVSLPVGDESYSE